jgi:glucose/arabinose dehydrogenase
LSRLVLGVCALGLLVGGCGGDSEPETTTTATGGGGGGAHAARGAAKIPIGDGDGGVELVEIGSFDQPLWITQPPGVGDELYVVEQCGRIMRLSDGEVAEQPFLDISDQVTCGGEQGLLSLAFAPDYARSGLLYVDFTDTAGDTRVVEYRRSAEDPAIADPASARVVLRQEQPFPNHNGGLLLFGPDDLLYIGLGDGGGSGDPMRNGQDLSTLLGKILRIDPRPSGDRPYSIPDTNPFVNRPGARPEVYDYGLRNPWRFSFDRLTEALWIGDVGEDAIEEVDGVTRADAAGANFGWSAFEGDERFNSDQEAPGHVPPVLAYPLDGACAVTGGYVVRDRRLESLYGRYLYGDFCVGELRSFTAGPERPASDDRPLGPQVPQLSSFGQDNAGRIYAVSLDGPVYRLDPQGS